MAKYITGLALALILGLVLTDSLPAPAQALERVNLELGGEGSTAWNICNIAPGDSGTKPVELCNTYSRNGCISIWISDVVSSEGLNPESETGNMAEPGELINYLLLNICCDRLKTNLKLPTTVDCAPQSVTDSNVIMIKPCFGHETINIVWEWEFHETGGSQNDAQGDTLSFNVNYLLE